MGELVGIGLAVLAAAGLAAQSLAVRLGTDTHRIADVLAVVLAVNLVAVLPAAAVGGAPALIPTLTRTAVGAFAIAGVLGSLFGRACYYAGIARLGASRAEPIKALLPVFAVGGAVVLLGERLTAVTVGGIGLLVIGGAAVATEARGSQVTATGRQYWIDVAFPALAALLYGIDPIFVKIGMAKGGSPLVGVAIRTAAAAAGFGVYLAGRGVWSGRIRPIAWDSWLVVAGVANTVYLLAYYAALARSPVAIVAPVLSVSTLLVLLGAAVFLRDAERVTWRLAAAAGLVVLGIAVVVRG